MADNEGREGVGEEVCTACSDFFLTGLRSGGGFFLIGGVTFGWETIGGEEFPD